MAEEAMCVYCVRDGPRICCGLKICNGECGELHRVKKIACGHESCNFKEAKECLMCEEEAKEKTENEKVEKDRALVKTMMEQATSEALKKQLQQFLLDPQNKKRKREDSREMHLAVKISVMKVAKAKYNKHISKND